MDRSYNTLHDSAEHELPEREISLGAPTILGIFFALALVCALFFGLGYSMGRRSTPAGTAVVASTDTPSGTSTTKPSSGSPADNPTTPPPTPATTPDPTTVTVPTANTPPPATPAAKPATTTPTSPVATLFIVQIAAVSHREDAETLVANLKLRGYDVAIREENQDKLLHVQIGPFTTRKDADAMRQHLLADGYNAIVK